MARPLRIEFPGAVYHVTARGDRKEAVYLDEEDRRAFLQVLGEVCGRFDWSVYAYCLMTNHYHLLLETARANLSRGMRQLNGVYTQQFNRRHERVGHIFQGRYKALLVQKESYLLELSRYLVLNPVRIGAVKDPGEWRWSSYRAAVGRATAPAWLRADWLLSQLGAERASAVKAYARFVEEGAGRPGPWKKVRHQMLLGDEGFVERFASQAAGAPLPEISKRQRRTLALPLAKYRATYPERSEAMARAYLSGAYTMKSIAEFFGVHYMTVSRAVRKHEDGIRDVGL